MNIYFSKRGAFLITYIHIYSTYETATKLSLVGGLVLGICLAMLLYLPSKDSNVSPD